VLVLRHRNRSVEAWCKTCDEQVQMVTPDEAAQLYQVSTRTVYRRIENGRLHFTETERGFSLICIQSLERNGVSNDHDSADVTRRPLRRFFRKSMKRMLERR
jgi:excisionase family DNA binding protein